VEIEIGLFRVVLQQVAESELLDDSAIARETGEESCAPLMDFRIDGLLDLASGKPSTLLSDLLDVV